MSAGTGNTIIKIERLKEQKNAVSKYNYEQSQYIYTPSPNLYFTNSRLAFGMKL